MKKLALVLALVVVLSVCCAGCVGFAGIGSLFTDMSFLNQEEALYNEAVDDFFAALDQGDANAIRALFSTSVQRTDEDLDRKIELLMQHYPGPTDTNTCDGSMLGGHYTSEHGVRTAEVYSTFPVISDGVYYWFTFRLRYVDDGDADMTGLTQVVFYTAEDYCQCRYDENWKSPEDEGLLVFADAELPGRVKAVDGYPYQFTGTETPLDPAEVKEFLKISDSCEAFTARFGPPHAVHIYEIYELLPEDGQPRYLQLGAAEDEIYGADVVSDLDWLYSIK